MIIYITPAGKTALLTTNFLDDAKKEFGFDFAFLLSDNGYLEGLNEKYREENMVVVPISNPYFGVVDYLPAVRRLVKSVMVFSKTITQVIVNSSGGTEKMTNIVKDAGDILSRKYEVLRVFGVYDKVEKEVVFTRKPNINHDSELKEIEEDIELTLKLKEEEDAPADLDFNKKQ